MNPFRNKAQSFEITYEMYADVLYRLALSYMKNREDAEDIVQEVFTKYFTGFHMPMTDEQEKAWLIRVTINQCHDAFRKKSYRLHDSLDDVAEIAASEEPQLQDLMSMLKKMPDKYQGVILLHYLEGYSVEETAKILGLSLSAAKMRLKRGRELLKEKIEEES